MWHDLNQAVLKKQPKWLFFPAGDQGASSAATKSCHSNKNRLTTPLTTYRKSKNNVGEDVGLVEAQLFGD